MTNPNQNKVKAFRALEISPSKMFTKLHEQIISFFAYLQQLQEALVILNHYQEDLTFVLQVVSSHSSLAEVEGSEKKIEIILPLVQYTPDALAGTCRVKKIDIISSQTLTKSGNMSPLR